VPDAIEHEQAAIDFGEDEKRPRIIRLRQDFPQDVPPAAAVRHP
jgi:hypothetical protein